MFVQNSLEFKNWISFVKFLISYKEQQEEKLIVIRHEMKL